MESLVGIGEGSVEVNLGLAGHVKVKVGIGGHCLGMVWIDGHFGEMAVIAECWEEEEGEVEDD